MLLFYVVYVIFVMGWHWWLSHRPNAKHGAGEGDVESEGNTHPSSTKETPLLSEARFEHLGPKVRGQFGLRRRRHEPDFWQYWADSPHHKVDHRAVNPSIGSTFSFRHQESLQRQHDAQEISTSNGQNGNSQIPSERQQTSLRAHESFIPRLTLAALSAMPFKFCCPRSRI